MRSGKGERKKKDSGFANDWAKALRINWARCHSAQNRVINSREVWSKFLYANLRFSDNYVQRCCHRLVPMHIHQNIVKIKIM